MTVVDVDVVGVDILDEWKKSVVAFFIWGENVGDGDKVFIERDLGCGGVDTGRSVGDNLYMYGVGVRVGEVKAEVWRPGIDAFPIDKPFASVDAAIRRFAVADTGIVKRDSAVVIVDAGWRYGEPGIDGLDGRNSNAGRVGTSRRRTIVGMDGVGGGLGRIGESVVGCLPEIERGVRGMNIPLLVDSTEGGNQRESYLSTTVGIVEYFEFNVGKDYQMEDADTVAGVVGTPQRVVKNTGVVDFPSLPRVSLPFADGVGEMNHSVTARALRMGWRRERQEGEDKE